MCPVDIHHCRNVEEIRRYFNEAYGIERAWPLLVRTNHKVYAMICAYVFKKVIEDTIILDVPSYYNIALGPNRGIMYKGVEFLIEE